MNTIDFFYSIVLSIQLLHSIEELSKGFHKKWYLFKMSFWVFLLFEILFSGFWIFILLVSTFPYKLELQAFFLLLMFSNGIQHIIWFGVEKKYVPGLLTAFLHIIAFCVFYFDILF